MKRSVANVFMFLLIRVFRALFLIPIVSLLYSQAAFAQPGEVKAWGLNQVGQLGDGTTTNRTTPVSVTGLTGVVAVAAGNGHTLALLNDGTVKAWGFNFFGSLGDGTTTGKTTPVSVTGLTGVVAIAAGGGHSLALLNDGTVRAWGDNNWFQLGDGTTTYRTAPVSVSGLTGVVAIAGGGNHSLALLGDGTVKAWGYNAYGQLGNGTTALFSTTPVAVSGLNGVVEIDGRGNHNLARLNDGTVRAWGRNQSGQLGDGTTTNRTTPVAVSGLSEVVEIATGIDDNGSHSLARLTDGTVRAWGSNVWGQLGDGTQITRTTPVPVSGLSGALAVAANRHSLAIVNITLPPTANAGLDQTVNEGANVVLDGTGSHDTNNPLKPITYAWTQLSGLPVTLANANTATPSFTAPSVPREGAVLVFQLTVSNGVTTPVSDTVNVNVVNVNTPPTADAGSPQTVPENSLVTLSGTGSDPDGDSLTLTWTQTGGPIVVLTGADTIAPFFTAPGVTLAQNFIDLQFTLTVNDGLISSGPSTVTVRVYNVNGRPIANPGAGQSVNELDLVTLDGSQSSDPDNDPLSYAWTQIAGPIVGLTGATTAMPSFYAPEVTPGGETLTFELAVSDGDLSNSAIVSVQVNNVNHPPLADAGPDQTVPENTLVNLNGSNSADTDGDTLTYAWAQTSGPAVTLSGSYTATTNFITPDTGPDGAVMKYQLTVNDGYGGVASDEVVVNVTYVNRPPTATAGNPQTVNEGAIATLSGVASDPDGNNLIISWTQVSGPTVTINNADSLAPSITAPQVTRAEDNVVLRLTADDGYGSSASSDVTIHIANVNRPPSAQAPANLSVPEGTLVNLIGQGSDPDSEEQIQLVYAWQQIAPVVGPSYAGSNLSFNAPLVTGGGDPSASLTLTFRLTVTDPNGAAASDDVDVVVTNISHAPTASAGGNLTVNEGASVTLNGSASNDPDGDPLSYTWVQSAGPAVTLNDANTAYPYFTAPLVNAAGATLKFTLTVNDGFGGTSSDVATVNVTNIVDPPSVANAEPSCSKLWPPNHRMVAISILGVSDRNKSRDRDDRDDEACQKSGRNDDRDDDEGHRHLRNITIRITGVSQDEPTNGLGDGDTPIDAIISPDSSSVLLRAERSGKGNGRVYHIYFTASNFNGSATGMVKVSVPHSKKSDVAIDGGELYDSTR